MVAGVSALKPSQPITLTTTSGSGNSVVTSDKDSFPNHFVLDDPVCVQDQRDQSEQ